MSARNDKQALWRRGYIRDLAALALLLLLCLLFFWRVITPNDVDRGSFRQGDFYDQFHAFAAFEFDQLSKGKLPLWNPYTYSGHPFLADVQSAIFYPLSLLTMLLSLLWGFSAFGLELEATAHFFLAGAFTYFFARRLFHNRGGALVSAVTFAFGGYLTSFPPLQLAILETVVWLPLILLFIDLGITELGHGRRGIVACYLLLAGLVLGVAILAGHPQSAMYLFYVALLYFTFKIWYVWKVAAPVLGAGGSRFRFGVAALGFLLFVLSGLGLAAVQALPSLEFMQLSSRPELGYEELASGFAYLDFLQILLPHATGFWSPLYVGIFPLLLALYALYLLVWGELSRDSARQRGWRVEIGFWAIVAGAALLLTVGDDSFLYSLFYLLVPGFGLFRGQERAAFVFSLALSLLAGYGFTALMNLAEAETRERNFRTLLRLVAGLALAVAVLTVLFLYGRSAPGATPGGLTDAMLGLGVFVLLLLGGSSIWLLVWRQHPGSGLLLGGLAILLVFLDLFTVNARPNVQRRKIENQVRASGVVEELQTRPGTFRVHNEWRLPGNYGCVYGLEDTWGASPLRLASYEHFVQRVPQERAWQLLNVGYVVTWLDELDVPATRIYEEPVKKEEVDYVHRLEEEHPRAWLVYEVEVLPGEDEILDRLAQPDFDPYRVALLTESLPSSLAGQPAEQTARLVDSGPSGLVVEVDQPADGLLVLSEIHYPGWQATVDGQQVPILRADGILRAVVVPTGQHRVEMTFEPLSVRLGLAISAITLLLSLAYLLWCLIVRVKKSNS
jgi:hypothetical protein